MNPWYRQLGFFLMVGSAAPVFGWGSYGHQQINRAAVQLLEESGSDLGKCLAHHRKFLQRLAITPDYDWKVVGQEPQDLALRHERAENDRYEHPLHFFEADAFVSPLWTLGSFVGEYQTVLPQLKKALAVNADEVEKIDPEKKITDKQNPTDVDVSTHGSAPWRIVQLNRLAQGQLDQVKQASDLTHGLFFFGANGHYQGDMSQPFHATLDFDGKSVNAVGIHHAFEEGILEAAAHAKKAMRGPDGLFDSFAATEGGVMTVARQKWVSTQDSLSDDELLSAVFALVQSTHSYIAPLEEQYIAAVKAVDDGSHKVLKDPGMSRALFAKYMDLKLGGAEHGQATVLEAAETLMGASAALVAMQWNTSYEAAKKNNPALESAMKDCVGAPEINFSLADAIHWYPKPEYLPVDAQASDHRSNRPGSAHDPIHYPPSGNGHPGTGTLTPPPPTPPSGTPVKPIKKKRGPRTPV